MSKNIGKKVLLIYIAMYVALNVISTIIVVSLNIDLNDSNANLRLTSISNLAFYGIMILLYISLFTDFWKKVILQFKQNSNKFLKLIAIGFGFLLLVSAFVSLGYKLFGITEISDNQEALDALLAGGWFDKFSLVMFAVFFAPVVEEMVFRMATFQLLHRIRGLQSWIIVLISSILFGLIHVVSTLDFVQLPYYAGLGLVLGYFYYKSKNIIVPIVIHMLLNAFVTITMFM